MITLIYTEKNVSKLFITIQLYTLSLGKRVGVIVGEEGSTVGLLEGWNVGPI